MDRALGKGKGGNKRMGGNKVAKAKGGAATNNNTPRKLSDRFDRIVHVAPAAKAKSNQRGKKAVVVVRKKDNAPGKGGKGKGNAAGKKENKKNNNKKGKSGAKPVKEKPKSADDLDLEMASYWHKAGKGPDPALAKLDDEMDSYFAKKETVEEVTVEEVTEEAPATE